MIKIDNIIDRLKEISDFMNQDIQDVLNHPQTKASSGHESFEAQCIRAIFNPYTQIKLLIAELQEENSLLGEKE